MEDSKNQLRQMVKSRLSGIPKEMQKELSLAVCQEILNSQQYKNARAVLSYIPLLNELDVSAVNEAVLESDKVLAVPKCVCHLEDDGTMRNSLEFYVMNKNRPITNQLVQGVLCKEPNVMRLEKFHAQSFSGDGDILILVPGLAFTKDGKRLGRGKGYYDGFLSELKVQHIPSFAMGVCFDVQLCDEIPCKAFDMRIDAISVSPSSTR